MTTGNPRKPKRICAYIGCGRGTYDYFCEIHAPIVAEQRRQADAQWRKKRAEQAATAERADNLYNGAWRRIRAEWLRQHPTCTECAKRGRLTSATEVDHIVPHRGDRALFYEPTNLQALCKPCHSRKTAKEDGGFGNRADPKATPEGTPTD